MAMAVNSITTASMFQNDSTGGFYEVLFDRHKTLEIAKIQVNI